MRTLLTYTLDNGNGANAKNVPSWETILPILLVAYELMKAIKDAQKKGHLKRDILLIVPAYHETLSVRINSPEDFDYDMITVNLFTIERCYVLICLMKDARKPIQS